MGSRLREHPENLFEVFLEVAKPDAVTEKPFIVNKYPPDYNEEETLKSVPKFAFPCDTERYTTTVDHFTFVLTDLESKYKFGYCRHATGAQTCLCIVSCLPWFEVFYSFLNLLAEMINRSEDNDVTNLLRAAFAQDVPTAGVPVQIVSGQEMWNFTAPDNNKLASIPSSRNLTEYYNAVDTENMMLLFASMLNERRIIITSKKLSRVTACAHAAANLLYPMYWQHLFIPILPMFLLEYLSAPMPYIIGVHSSLLQKVKKSEIDDAVIMDVDGNTMETVYDDFEDLPSEISSYLKRHLRGEKMRQNMLTSGDAIPKIFLMALVKLIGGYRDALRFKAGEPITFCPDAFVQSRHESMQPFLQKMLCLQIFQQFVNDRLDMLNCGEGFQDIFEQQAMVHADKLNAQSRYKEWVSSMKKQGKKFQRGGKDIWADFKVKAAPVMSNAVENMKHRGKKAYSGIKTKFSELRKEDVSKTPGRDRPTTINLGQELHSQRPPRPQPPSPNSQLDRSPGHEKSYRPTIEKRESVDDSELGYKRVSMNLLLDPDIQNALNKSASAENISPREHPLLEFDENESGTSSGQCSPYLFKKLIDVESIDSASIGTQDSLSSIPYMDGSMEAQGSSTTISTTGSESERPVPPPRRAKSKRNPKLPDRLVTSSSNRQHPVPAPRKSLTEESSVLSDINTKPPVQDSKSDQNRSLIQLDSFDAESDTFDPFSSHNSSTVSNLDSLKTLDMNSPAKEGEDDEILNTFLTRKMAMKRPVSEMPKVQVRRPEIAPRQMPKKSTNVLSDESDDVFSSFDPLNDLTAKNAVNQNTQNGSQGQPKGSSELLQTWDIRHLSTKIPSPTPGQVPVSRRASLPHSPRPGFQGPTAQARTSVSRPPLPPKPSLSSGETLRTSQSSPLHLQQSKPEFLFGSGHSSGLGNTNGGKSREQVDLNRISDPFDDLLGLTLSKTTPDPPKQNWEKFD